MAGNAAERTATTAKQLPALTRPRTRSRQPMSDTAIRFRVKARNGGGSADAVSAATAAIKAAAAPVEQRAADDLRHAAGRQDTHRTSAAAGHTIRPPSTMRGFAATALAGAVLRSTARATAHTPSLPADVGNTLRLRVTARNPTGGHRRNIRPDRRDPEGGDARSPAPPTNGCPAGNPKQVAACHCRQS